MALTSLELKKFLTGPDTNSPSMALPNSTAYKVIVIGGSCAGKTCILDRLIDHKFSDCTFATLGCDLRKYSTVVDSRNVRAHFWSTASPERFRSTRKFDYRGAVGAVAVYDLTRGETFTDLTDDWIPSFREVAGPKAKIVIVGNKSDLVEAGGEVELEAERFAAKNGYSHWVVSAKTGEGVDECFEEFVRLIVRSGVVPGVSAAAVTESPPAMEREADSGHLSRRSRRKASWEYIYP
jgi:small GTP-binding protein